MDTKVGRAYDVFTQMGHAVLAAYDLLRDYLNAQTKDEFILTFDQIEDILDAALPRAAHRASWWETARSPDLKMPQREACLAAGYVATRMKDGTSVRFTKRKKPLSRRVV